MANKYFRSLIILSGVVFLAAACKTFVVKEVNYAHQLESVLTPNEDGVVNDTRHGISYSIIPFQQQEFGENSDQQVEEVRMIRNADGYYFITASKFKNVYVMEPAEGELKLKKKIKVTEDGLKAPAFNLRSPFVQLVDTSTTQTFTLNENGIHQNKGEEQS